MTARRLLAAAGVLAVLAAGSVALGQEAAPAAPKPPTAPANSIPGRGGSPYTPTFDVEFPGGTLAAFVKAVQDSAAAKSHSVNVVIPADAEKIPVPRLSLKSVTASTALASLRFAFADSSDYKAGISEFGSTADGGSSSFAVLFSQSSKSVFGAPPPQATESSAIEVFSIRDAAVLLGGGDEHAGAEHVIAAVDAALSLDDGERAHVKYHPEAAILIVKGRKSQVRTAADVLSRLRQDAGEAEQRRDEQSIREANTRAELEQAQLGLELNSQRLQSSREQLQRAEELAKAGQIGTEEVRAARDQAVAAENELKQAEVRMRVLRDRADATRAAVQGGAAHKSRVLIVYDATDLQPFFDGLREVMENTAGAGSKVQAVNNSLVVTATPEEQKAVIALMNLLRRLKANDPKLPGSTIEDVMSGAKKEGGLLPSAK